MALLTTVCSACGCIGLTRADDAAQGALACSVCKSPLQIVPGCMLHADEQGLFNDLVPVVAESAMAPIDALALGRRIGTSLRAGGYHGLLESLTMRLPGLLPFQVTAGRNLPANQRVLKVLRAILEARALAPQSELRRE